MHFSLFSDFIKMRIGEFFSKKQAYKNKVDETAVTDFWRQMLGEWVVRPGLGRAEKKMEPSVSSEGVTRRAMIILPGEKKKKTNTGKTPGAKLFGNQSFGVRSAGWYNIGILPQSSLKNVKPQLKPFVVYSLVT